MKIFYRRGAESAEKKEFFTTKTRRHEECRFEAARGFKYFFFVPSCLRGKETFLFFFSASPAPLRLSLLSSWMTV